ncbi:unnamed protein product, partial [Meganyctiphanes norvegica]
MCVQCKPHKCDMRAAADVLSPLCAKIRQFYKKQWIKLGQSIPNNEEIKEGDILETDCVTIQDLVRVPSACNEIEFNGIHDDQHFTDKCYISNSSLHPFPTCLEKEGIRVLLFRECDVRGRKLLYDSKTVVRVPVAESSTATSCKALFARSSKCSGTSLINTASSNTFSNISNKTSHRPPKGSNKTDPAEICNGHAYQYLHQESDTKQIGELVFGSVALAYRGSYSKLHLLTEPSRALLSRIASAPHAHQRPSHVSDPGIEDSFGSSVSSSDAMLYRTDSLEVPWGGPSWPMEITRVLSSSTSEGDSGFGAPPSPYSSTCGSFLSPHSRSNTPSSNSSRQGSGNSLNNSGSISGLQRRFLRTVNTSLNALAEGSQDELSSSHKASSTRLGLAVIVDLSGSREGNNKEMEQWFFNHLTVIEGALNKLQNSLNSAYLHRRSFVSATYRAVLQLQQDLLDLACSTRLSRPVWLGLLGGWSQPERQGLCSSFVNTLITVLRKNDTKQTNFFVSKLLTAVLTNHLGWVSTVAPGKLSEYQLTDTQQQHETYVTHSEWVERLNECHPYNAMWAQLCELSGAVGYPPRASRTILYGSDTQLLTNMLTILSYIVRCSQIKEQEIFPCTNDASSNVLGTRNTSQTSVTSILTVLDEPRRDSQATITMARRNSQTTLFKRDSGLRRSWRTSCGKQKERRENNGTTDQRQTKSSGDVSSQTKEVVLPETISDHHIPEVCISKESEVKSKWTLNDDDEIVIKDFQSSSSNLTDSSITSPNDYSSINPTINMDISKSISVCKTSNNLADMFGHSPAESSPVGCVMPVLSSYSELPVTRPSGSLYPSLVHFEEHRDNFGPTIVEPMEIASKVQKIVRVPEESQKSCLRRQSKPETGSRLLFQMPEFSTFPRISKHASNTSVESDSSVIVDDISKIKSLSGLSSIKREECIPAKETIVMFEKRERRRSQHEVIVPGKDIETEVEEGGKILFLDRLSVEKIIDQRNVRARSEEVYRSCDTPQMNVNGSPVLTTKKVIKCLPSPVDLQKVVRCRNVGRESAKDLTILGRENTMYPSLSEIKEQLGSNQINVKSSTSRHKRTHSDPTNGGFVTKVVSYSQPYRGLLESLREYKDTSTLQHNQQDKFDFQLGESFTREKQNSSGDDPLNDSDKSLTPVKDEDTSLTPENELTFNGDQPIGVKMPICVTGSDNSSKASLLAESLLGGVLDHYSSVFVVQGTTASPSQWEDQLRLDLSCAAHHSHLHQQLAEAVAVVADVDNWEVQIVSSHSYAVDHCGSGGLAGLPVGMSPLISAITDSILDLAQLGVQPQFIVEHFEDRLRELYFKSQLLSEYLLGKQSNLGGGIGGSYPQHGLPELTRALGLDVNDLPLLLAVASTHTPALTRMFGISIR